MRELAKEIGEVLKTVVPSRPVFKMSKNYDGVRLNQVFKPSMESSSFLADTVAASLSEELDVAGRRMLLRDSNVEDVANSARYNVRSTIVTFLRDYQDTKNNKLTTLYRWYNEFLDNGRLKNDVQFDNDMYHVFKAIKTHKEKYVRGDKFPNGIVSVLNVLKRRYEAQGMKL